MRMEIVILAAGESSRMGSPKQLIDWHGKPLLRHLAEQALATGEQVTIVLGAHLELIRPTIADLPVRIIVNDDWREGMASSICATVSGCEADAALLMVCDQPLVTTATLQALIDDHQDGVHPIVASAYANTLGVPALFDRGMFGELLQLQGRQGAKAVIQRHQEAVLGIPFAEGTHDLDTPGDVDALLSQR